MNSSQSERFYSRRLATYTTTQDLSPLATSFLLFTGTRQSILHRIDMAYGNCQRMAYVSVPRTC